MPRSPHLQPQAVASTTASTSHVHSTPLGIRQRHEQRDTYQEAISSGAYISRPPASGRKSKWKGKQKEDPGPRWRIGSRGWVKEGFRIFGEHCARNQIRTLLIDCLVMTNLFYPALSIYLQKRFPPLQPSRLTYTWNDHGHSHHSHTPHKHRKDHPLSILSTPILDSFFPYPPPLLPRLSYSTWWDDTGQDADNWDARRLTGSVLTEHTDDEIRLLRVAWADVGDILDDNEENKTWSEADHTLLHLVRDTAEGWSSITGEGCVRDLTLVNGAVAQHGPCIMLSPDVTPDERVISLPELSAGSRPHGSSVDPTVDTSEAGRIYRSVAVPFHVPVNSTSSFDERWREALTSIARNSDGELFVEAVTPGSRSDRHAGQWELSYRQNAQSDGSSVDNAEISTPKSVLFLYFVLFTVLGAQLSLATKVHSRFGLAFTGLVQLCCSAVMSFSVLALLGWNGWGWNTGMETSLPTYVLPFVIVVVGAENMSTLTKAVFSVPFSHSVPVRIGLGLSKVGTTIAWTSLTDLALLGVIWLFVNLRPIREFCLFAAVVIITDWFMLHTFFLTVLSIDAQRLELADVLASNGGTNPAPRADNDNVPKSEHRFSWKRLLRARTSKSGSLILILLCVGVIYYLTGQHRVPLSVPNLYGYNPPVLAATSNPFTTSSGDLLRLSRAEKFWRALNARGQPSIRVLIPSSTIIILPRLGHSMRPPDLRKLTLPTSRTIIPRLKPLFYLFKVLFLPQMVTAGLLYSLLLFLLKDSDLLDAQRNRLGRGEEGKAAEEETAGLQDISVHMLPCSHEADVDLVVSGRDGKLVVSVGMDNTVCLWRLQAEATGTGTREILNPDAKGLEPVCAVAISPDGTIIAVATLAGTIQLWDVIDENAPRPRSPLALNGTARILDIRFVHRSVRPDDPFIARPSSPVAIASWDLVVPLSGGAILAVCDGQVSELIQAPKVDARTFFVDTDYGVDVDQSIVVTTRDGSTLYRRSEDEWYPSIVSTTSPTRITAVTAMRDMVAFGHASGLVEVFDITGTLIVAIGQSSSTPTRQHPPTLEGIKKVAMVQPISSRCVTCGTSTSDCVYIVSSASEHINIDRVTLRPGTIACRCARRPSTLDEMRATPGKLVIPPMTTRVGVSPGSSPKRSPSLLPPVSNGEFPLSSHGTRRLSAMHREDGSSPVPDGLGMTPLAAGHSGDEVEVAPLGAILVPGGGTCWTINGDRVTGVRRTSGGIDDDQWEMWTLDLRSPWNGQSLLVRSAPLTSLLRAQPRLPSNSISEQRRERLLSLSGRAPFPSIGSSFSIATFRPLAYVDINPFHAIRGDKQGIIMGLGNRLALVSLPAETGILAKKRSNLGAASVGLGLIPRPPPVRRDTAERIEMKRM